MSFLIFYLKQESLQIYRFSQSLVLIDKIFSSDFLNLSENFENLWQNCSPVINLESEIYFVLGQNSSFTDTRIVYLWLQSWRMFANFCELKLENSTNLKNTNKNKKPVEKFWKEKIGKTEQIVQKITQIELISKQFWVHKLEKNLVLEFLEKAELKKLFAKIKVENNQKLLYTNEARIGQNKLNNKATKEL